MSHQHHAPQGWEGTWQGGNQDQGGLQQHTPTGWQKGIGTPPTHEIKIPSLAAFSIDHSSSHDAPHGWGDETRGNASGSVAAAQAEVVSREGYDCHQYSRAEEAGGS
eukprot:654906-Karenia_brevis.AAC.1